MSERPTTRFSIDPAEFAGKRALVTGGTKGIGEAIVDRLTAGGATVATTARSASTNTNRAAVFVQADIGSRTGVDAVVRTVMTRLGGVDILVNNVGGSSAPGGGVLALSDDDWQTALDANLLAAVRLDHAFLPGMLAQKSGAIIHISSIQRRLHLVDPAATAAVRGHARLRGCESGADDLQQGVVQGSRAEGRAREFGRAGIHRDDGGRRSRRPPRRAGGNDRGARASGLDGFTRRDSDRPARSTRRSRGARRVPRVGPGRLDSR